MNNVDTNIKNKSIIKILINCIWIVYSSIAAICIAALAVINSTWIYKIVVSKFNLSTVTGISKQALIDEYRGLINYLENPFIQKLKFDNFAMSTYGEVHFHEVKKIFMMLIVIVAIFFIASIGWFIISKYKKNLINIKGLLKNFNSSANLLIGFFIGIVVLYFIDFSWAFTMFHKIFFRNNYWIFDPKLDPIIIALPEELFMICGGAILFVLLAMIIGVKYGYYRSKNKKVYSHNSIDV